MVQHTWRGWMVGAVMVVAAVLAAVVVGGTAAFGDLKPPLAGEVNVRQAAPPWAGNISHGELLRTGFDETLTVDPANLRFLIQGVTQKARAGKKYGDIPWRLGLLTRAARG